MKSTRVLLLLPLLLLASVAVFAQHKQKFSVVSFEEQPLDMTAREDGARKDGTGSLYAIIKVTSTNPDDDLRAYSFDFDYLKHIVEAKDGELWVYVQRNAKHVTITRGGYQTVKDYDLRTTIQAGKVYAMQLSSEVRRVYKQIVQFNVVPADAGAVVFCKSTENDAKEIMLGVVDSEGSVAASLELGTYTYRVTSTKYHESEGRFTLNDRSSNHVENVKLRSNFSTITFNTGDGVDIYIDDEKVGVGTWTGVLNTGTYSVECRKAGYRPVEENIKIEENLDRTIQLRHPTPITGALAVITRPLGAEVYIDGIKRGISPITVNDLLVGKHTVEVKKNNYDSDKAVVEVLDGETTEKIFTLNDVADFSFTSNPSGATLYIDGKKVGVTPYRSKMASGDYDIRLNMKGYTDFNERVHLNSSNPDARFSLKRVYHKESTVYVQGRFQFGGFAGYGGGFGAYMNNFNIEGYVMMGVGSETVYEYVYTDGSSVYSHEQSMSAMALGVKAGYGFVLSPRVRITPQLGLGTLSVKAEDLSTSAVTASLGVRCEYALSSRLGIALTPDYTFTVHENDLYKKVSLVSSKCNGWGNGFNVCVGLYLCF
ncbi:MAG: PEGA domain-containing protein [Bacteroidaceae bacterium]|nr:PEGA domain-containing protein [Bacteroidaceae bacterium]